jgi:hypothetical protein
MKSILALAPYGMQVAGWSSGQIPRITPHDLFKAYQSWVEKTK